ncbi:MAG: PfkB family carbohydrate kinase [Pseudomonadota bacterium]
MTKLFEGFKGNRFGVFGRVGMDLFATPVGTKSTHADSFDADIGGSAANICVGLEKLGSRAALITSVSDDAVGRFCTRRLAGYGVDVSLVRAVAGECRTSLAVYESSMDDFQNVIYRNNAADFQVTEADMAAVDYTAYTAIISAGTVFAAEPSRSATFKVFEDARAAGLPIIFDIDYRPYSWPSAEVAADVLSRASTYCDMIVGNDEEFGFMAGGYGKGLEMARELGAKDCLTIYKMGEGGALTFTGGTEISTGIYPVTAVKPNGAGDSFMSGLLASLAGGLPLKDAVLRGSACASIVVSKPGCAPAMPTMQELETFLASHPGPTAGPVGSTIAD